jgi:hypothetical protein
MFYRSNLCVGEDFLHCVQQYWWINCIVFTN